MTHQLTSTVVRHKLQPCFIALMTRIFIPNFFHFRIRELTSQKIGTLLRISGQVVRTHPVHPELVTGTFICLDCQTVIKDIEQQFKYTQVCYFSSLMDLKSFQILNSVADEPFSSTKLYS